MNLKYYKEFYTYRLPTNYAEINIDVIDGKVYRIFLQKPNGEIIMVKDHE